VSSSKGKWVAAVLGLSIAVIIFVAPYYLTYSDVPRKVDAVVVLVGPGLEARMKEAKELARKRLIKYIFVPAHSELRAGFEEHLNTGDNPNTATCIPSHTVKVSEPLLSYQSTYKELLRAKEMIDRYGFRSAIIVSSPYHMRRIKIMCSNVFPSEQYDILCVATRYEHTHRTFWFLYRYDRKWILTEYGKIAWFLAN